MIAVTRLDVRSAVEQERKHGGIAEIRRQNEEVREIDIAVSVEVTLGSRGINVGAKVGRKDKEVGEIYFASMPWLREAPLCRS